MTGTVTVAPFDVLRTPQVRHVDRRRGHRFCPPKADIARVPELYGTEHTASVDDITIYLHFFVGGCDWWVAEADPVTGRAFGPCKTSGEIEWGYFMLDELAVATTQSQLNGAGLTHLFRQPVERDCHWHPTAWKDVQR